MGPFRASYPIRWRVMDAIEAAAARLWPRRFSAAIPYLMLAPAVLLVLLLVIGMVQIADSSLHVLDRTTFLPSDEYTIANYEAALQQPLYWMIIWRSLFGAAIVTVLSLAFAFPYAYL